MEQMGKMDWNSQWNLKFPPLKPRSWAGKGVSHLFPLLMTHVIKVGDWRHGVTSHWLICLWGESDSGESSPFSLRRKPRKDRISRRKRRKKEVWVSDPLPFPCSFSNEPTIEYYISEWELRVKWKYILVNENKRKWKMYWPAPPALFDWSMSGCTIRLLALMNLERKKKADVIWWIIHL